MYRLYVYGRDDISNNISELFEEVDSVKILCEKYRSEGLVARVYFQKINDSGDIVESLVDI